MIAGKLWHKITRSRSQQRSLEVDKLAASRDFFMENLQLKRARLISGRKKELLSFLFTSLKWHIR